jgi:hypothetical protein
MVRFCARETARAREERRKRAKRPADPIPNKTA